MFNSTFHRVRELRAFYDLVADGRFDLSVMSTGMLQNLLDEYLHQDREKSELYLMAFVLVARRKRRVVPDYPASLALKEEVDSFVKQLLSIISFEILKREGTLDYSYDNVYNFRETHVVTFKEIEWKK